MKYRKIFLIASLLALIVSFVSSCGNQSNKSAYGSKATKDAFEKTLQGEFDRVVSVLNRYSRIHYDFYYSYYADEETDIQVIGQKRLNIFKAMMLDELSVKAAKSIEAEEYKKTFGEFIDGTPHNEKAFSESDYYDEAFCYMFFDTGAYDQNEMEEGIRTLAVYFLGRVLLKTGVIQ